MDALSLISSAQSRCFVSSYSSLLYLCMAVRAISMPIFVGMTSSMPYARANGVFLVGCSGVIW